MLKSQKMKTEDEYSQLFLENCQIEKSNELELLSKNYWSDLTSHLQGHFSHESRQTITITAANKLNLELKKGRLLNEAWSDVIRDFISNNLWNESTTRIKPLKKQTEEQIIFWRLFRYTWSFFQAMVILKIAVYYFGLEGANRPDEIHPAWVWVFFGLSAGSLTYFAYRNRND